MFLKSQLTTNPNVDYLLSNASNINVDLID